MPLRAVHSIQSTYLFLALFISALLLLAISANTRYLAPVETVLRALVQPIVYVRNIPTNITEYFRFHLTSNAELQQRNDELLLELSQLNAAVSELDAAKATIAELRATLGATTPSDPQTILAEIIYVNPNRQRHEVVINVGERDGVGVDNGVLDPWGVFGRTVEVYSSSSRVLLINDERNATPSLVKRTRSYFITSGNGSNEPLSLDNVNLTEDIQAGDELVTSGLGNIYPEGLPVGVVASTTDIVAESAKHVTVMPRARLNAKSYLRVIIRSGPP